MELRNRNNQLLKKSITSRLKAFIIFHLVLFIIIALIFTIVFFVARDEMTNFYQVISIVPIMFFLIATPIYLSIFEAVKKTTEFNTYIAHNQTRSTYLRISFISKAIHFLVAMLEIVVYITLLKPAIRSAIAVEGNFDESDMEFFEFLLGVSVFEAAFYCVTVITVIMLIGFLANVWITSPKKFAFIWTPVWLVIWSMLINPWDMYTHVFNTVGSFLRAVYGAPLLIALIVIGAVFMLIDLAWTKRLNATDWGGPAKI